MSTPSPMNVDEMLAELQLTPVRQRLSTRALGSVEAATRSELTRLWPASSALRGAEVAIAVGSRGIAQLPVLVRSTVEHFAQAGAHPFIVPAMGSHGGATALGQEAVLAQLGVTADTAGCPIRSSMEVVEVGVTPSGIRAVIDAHAAEADGIFLLNRVKAHTAFRGPVESGLLKMLAVGLGKQVGARTLHDHGLLALRHRVPEVSRFLLERAPILGGLAIIENGRHEVARVCAARADEFFDREPPLLRSAKARMPRFPYEEVDVLILDEIGKDLAGSGWDLKLLGRAPGIPCRRPKIRHVVVLGLTAASHGNAMGIGAADFTTQRLVDAMDPVATRTNALTANAPNRAKLPPWFGTDREAIAAALQCVRDRSPGDIRVVRVANSLDLELTHASRALMTEVADASGLEPAGAPSPLLFDSAGRLLPMPTPRPPSTS